ncbi:MAG TPA: Crp/Fnr family transcriptional regulator [Albitalea sp.]|nr:Crp/Fnr family transcriptional regulator [Albitalea sp.]
MSPDVEAALRQVLSANFPALGDSRRVIAAAAADCRVKRLARLGVLLTQGRPTPALFGMLEGEVEVRFGTPEGGASVVQVLPPGRLFGLSSFVSGRGSTFDAVATRPSRVLAIGPRAYATLMDEWPGFARALMHELACRHDHALRLLEASRHQDAPRRLVAAIEALERDGRADAPQRDGRRLLRASQAELAAVASLSRQTVNELVARWAREGRVSTVYRGLWLHAGWPGAGA